MSDESRAFTCFICGAKFGANPRIDRWLAGTLPPAEAPRANMCWVCNRLSVHLGQEAKATAEWMEVEDAK